MVKRILQVFGSLDLGGAETMIVNILRRLDTTQMVFDFIVSGSEEGYYEQQIKGLSGEIYHIRKRSCSFIGHHLDFYRVVKENGYKIIHFHEQNAFLMSMQAVVARLAGAETLIIHSHNSMDWRGKKFLLMHRAFRPLLCHSADVRLACSKEAARWLYGKVRRVEIIPLPVDCQAFLFQEETRKRQRSLLGIDSEDVYLHVGRFNDVKNHEYLIEIFQQIVKIRAGSRLLLAGSGELQEQVRIQVKNCGLEKKVTFLGDISDVNAKMMAADAFLFPSKYEGFPTVLLEAQATGLPSYISDRITPDIIMTDLIAQLSINQKAELWAKQIVQERRKWRGMERKKYNGTIAKHYDISVVMEKFMKLYNA